MRLAFLLLPFSFLLACSSQNKLGRDTSPTKSIASLRKNCWRDHATPTLLSLMNQQIARPLETDLARDNYVQTFGCAYEEVDIEKNSIRAVYRAILQALRNRNIEARDELLALLHSRPPRPDNLQRDYTIYVKLPGAHGTNGHVASYQIRILDLEVVRTVESPVAVWTRIVSRFSHREDHLRAPVISQERSEFVRVLEKAQQLMELMERQRFEEVWQQLQVDSARVVDVRFGAEALIFGDRLRLVDTNDPRRTYPAIFLGKGMFFGMTPQGRPRVLKFGEEKLFGLRLDFQHVLRTDARFERFGYRAPETILQCLFLKSR